MLDSFQRWASAAALIATAAGAAYTIVAIARIRAFRRSLSAPRPPFSAPVTVLKPLHGDEPDLYANLSSFCEQAYPEFQIIFGAADAQDRALDVARQVQRDHPECDIAIVGGRAATANNPKIGNLLGMMPVVKHDIIAIADSDIRVGKDYLQAVAATFADANTGAATCIYGGIPNDSLASRLGAMFVNDQFSPSVLVAQTLEPLTYCFGATMAVRRAVLERIGGFGALAAHLGDDYMLGKLVSDAGHRVVLCPYIVHTGVAERGLRSLFAREVRWGRTIRASRPAGYAGSIVTHLLPLSIAFAALCARPIAGLATIAFAAMLRTLLHLESRKTFAPAIPASLALIPVRDALSVGVWCASYSGQRVAWHGDRYRINADGRMVGSPEECNDSV